MSGEVAERAKRIIVSGTGGAVGSGVGALMLAAGVATNNPALAHVGMLAGPFVGAAAEEGIRMVTAAWWSEGVQQFADAIESQTGESVEKFVTKANFDRKTRRLLGQAVSAAADSADEEIVDSLARAFVKGAKDADKVDAMSDLVGALQGVQGKHVRVMAVLAKEPYERTVDAVREADPGLGHTVAILCRDLDRLGLVTFVKWNMVKLSAVGWSCAALLDEIGSLHKEQGHQANA